MLFALRMAGAAAGAMTDHEESYRARALFAALALRRRTRLLPGTERAPSVTYRGNGSGRPQRRGCGWRLGRAAERDADAV